MIIGCYVRKCVPNCAPGSFKYKREIVFEDVVLVAITKIARFNVSTLSLVVCFNDWILRDPFLKSRFPFNQKATKCTLYSLCTKEKMVLKGIVPRFNTVIFFFKLTEDTVIKAVSRCYHECWETAGQSKARATTLTWTQLHHQERRSDGQSTNTPGNEKRRLLFSLLKAGGGVQLLGSDDIQQGRGL